jgi:hypothetical protein
VKNVTNKIPEGRQNVLLLLGQVPTTSSNDPLPVHHSDLRVPSRIDCIVLGSVRDIKSSPKVSASESGSVAIVGQSGKSFNYSGPKDKGDDKDGPAVELGRKIDSKGAEKRLQNNEAARRLVLYD